MKVAVPVTEKSYESNVYASFGRAPYFLIYDTETKKSKFIENSAATSMGGAGIKAAQTIIDNKVNVVLAPRCGQNAAHVIQSADILIYKTVAGSAKDNIDAFVAGKLSLLDEIHAGFHGR
ncbi:MAG TPA: NifB/NifX family molybdenum-iron cluster-binding protein [Clostridia bacterium]|jgi:predicted Fe-Mo cluster-binding NifX family protein|nr:NifB/NifX family molybdenum-iron cluster-binding protein [Clostridia bacterium]HQC69007.1 NifB/NifX family molybdenum-iron cluster-binding protein [Clostridia bacterium]